MLEILKSDDWERAFSFGLNPGPSPGLNPNDFLRKPFTRDDVLKILVLRRGNRKRAPGWVCVCRLNDRRYVFIYAAAYENNPEDMSERYGWSYTNLSLVGLLTANVRNDYLKDIVSDVRKLAHSDDVENDTKAEIVELALGVSAKDQNA